jgi:hypothetical protein
METASDKNIESGIYKTALRFRRAKMNDLSETSRILKYKAQKMTERFKGTIASDFHIEFYEQDRDNFIKDLVTVVLWFEYIRTFE